MPIELLVGSLPKGWAYSTLGAVCSNGGGGIQTGPFGSQLHKSDYVAVGIPSIMPTNIGDNRILTDGIARITPEDAARLSKYLVRAGDIVYSRRGNVEKRALIREAEAGWLCGTGCLRVRVGEHGPDPTYTSYYLGHPAVREWIVRHAHGATMPNLNTSILSALPIAIPPMREQEAIADILRSLDDKIELNRRMSETLESLAETIFRSWFVDFDSVEQLKPSVLGPVPEGWDVGPIGGWVEPIGGATPSTKNLAYWDGGSIPWATPKDLSGHQGAVLLDTSRHITSAGLARISSGLLPKGSLLFSSRAPIGYGAILDQPMAINQGFIAIRPGEALSPAYMYFWTKVNLDVIKSHAGGSTFAEISKRAFRQIPSFLPPLTLRLRFDSLAEGIFDRIALVAHENATLSEIRDTLLPKLISGELRVPQAEELVGEVI